MTTSIFVKLEFCSSSASSSATTLVEVLLQAPVQALVQALVHARLQARGEVAPASIVLCEPNQPSESW